MDKIADMADHDQLVTPHFVAVILLCYEFLTPLMFHLSSLMPLYMLHYEYLRFIRFISFLNDIILKKAELAMK